MKKLLVLCFFALIVFACDKTKDDVIVIKSSDIQMMIPNLPENPAPGTIQDIPEATYPRKVFDTPMLKNGEEPGVSTLEPATVSKMLKAGHGFTESKTAHIEAAPPKGDILFMFDLTGSMGGAIENAKVNSQNVMGAVRSLISDSEFGVVSHMDYDGEYNSCGYWSYYGYADYGDYPYRMDQAITTETTAVEGAINSLSLGNGGDWAEDYTRVLYETMNDPTIGWREDAKKIVVAFLDNVPHDCMIETGADPGRDAIVGNSDDLDFKEVLSAMKDQNIT